MRQINFGMILSLLLVTTLLSSCASFYKPEKEIVTVTKLVERNIPTVPSPKPVQMNDVKIYVVSPSENFEEFKKEFEAKNGADSYIAISVKDYENLAKNFAELRRYIEQQKQIILYYEEAVKPSEPLQNRRKKMIDIIIDLAMTWWQFTVVAILIVVGFIINMFGVDNKKKRIGFEYTEMPHMKPIPIPTAGKGFWGAIWMWLTGTRHWIVAKDFVYKIDEVEYVVPKGFKFDGASIPKFLHTWVYRPQEYC